MRKATETTVPVDTVQQLAAVRQPPQTLLELAERIGHDSELIERAAW